MPQVDLAPEAALRRRWHEGAGTLCAQVAHTALFGWGLWLAKQRVGARVALEIGVAGTMYGAVLAATRVLP